jgi:UDP-2-acetamido-3-amino-2,3-dideoxy-glucuronate N-acetyltransferase
MSAARSRATAVEPSPVPGATPPFVHRTAEVSPDARIGPGTRIWNGVQVREGAVIGALCIVGKDAYIDAGVHIGDRVKIENGALLFHGLTVENGVFIGPGAILTNDRHPRAILPTGEPAGDADWALSPIVLRTGCSIGAGAVVVAGSDVGSWALVGAGAVVTRSVPAHAIVVGNPARPIGWACVSGHRLVDGEGGPFAPDGEGRARCPVDERRYRIEDGRCTELPS